MKQIGNLASVCARKNNVLFQILDGNITVHILSKTQSARGPDKKVLKSKWDDDAKINEIIYELNFGRYSSNTDF